MKKRNFPQLLIGLLLVSVLGCRSEEDKSMVIEVRNNTSTEIPKARLVAVGSVGESLLAEKENLDVGVTHRQSA